MQEVQELQAEADAEEIASRAARWTRRADPWGNYRAGREGRGTAPASGADPIPAAAFNTPKPLQDLVGKTPAEVESANVYLQVVCPVCPGYTAPEPKGEPVYGMKYPKHSKIGPVVEVENTRTFVSAKIKDGPRTTWVNIWSKYNLQGKPVGVTYAHVVRRDYPGEPVVPQVSEPQAAA